MKPTEELKAEHEGVLHMLDILGAVVNKNEAKENVPKEHFDGIFEFLRVFVDRCHHGKEEDFLFPAMEAAGVSKEGGPIGVMLMEHQAGRDFVTQMEAGIKELLEGEEQGRERFRKAARNYIDLLRQHIHKENTVLFPMAEAKVPAEKLKSMEKDFAKVEEERIGPGKHDEFHARLEQYAGIYLK